jgi:hypothetical protein
LEAATCQLPLSVMSNTVATMASAAPRKTTLPSVFCDNGILLYFYYFVDVFPFDQAAPVWCGSMSEHYGYIYKEKNGLFLGWQPRPRRSIWNFRISEEILKWPGGPPVMPLFNGRAAPRTQRILCENFLRQY